ncbi:MAG: hypothetical protein RJA13_688 [Bacteroidota bacterium]|jgi:hypothetical protein
MKILLFSLALLFGFQLSAQETTKKASAKKETVKKKGLTFTKLEIVRDAIPYGSEELFSFEFKNDSKTPAIIQGVQTSCGCTTANKPEAPIKPGKKSEISVKYDTKRVGQFTKTITITSNVSEPITLTIRGTVLPEPEK